MPSESGGDAYGIAVDSATVVDDNMVSAESLTKGYGIYGNATTTALCSNNIVIKLNTPIDQCKDGGGNDSL